MEPCRYLDHHDGRAYCAYWDLPLCHNEDIRCYPGGWECYEEPGGCIFEGRWMTLAEYIEHLQDKSDCEIPEGYEFQEFRLDSEGLGALSRLEQRRPLEWMTGEFHYLKMRPGYPHEVSMVALARLQSDATAIPSRFDSPSESRWIASLCLVAGPCQVDLSFVRGEERLECIEGYCCHGESCPKVEELEREVLQSAAFAVLREDMAAELFQKALVDRCTTYDS